MDTGSAAPDLQLSGPTMVEPSASAHSAKTLSFIYHLSLMSTVAALCITVGSFREKQSDCQPSCPDFAGCSALNQPQRQIRTSKCTLG